jgi:serine/threonine protein kinase
MTRETMGSAALRGALLSERYRLLQLLGRGAFGAVYEAEHVEVGRRYAVKLLHRGLDSQRSRERFAREARVLARLEHENIVGLIDVGMDTSVGDFLVLELIRGSTLRDALPALKDEPLRVFEVVRQLARGLGHAHAAGVVHRDLKPENVMLSSHADGRLLVKILDFGIARLLDPQRELVTASGAALGTAAYMAPEQARGASQVDQRVDVYALGVILYEALAGVRPFDGASYNETLYRILTERQPPLAALRSDLDPALSELVERALMKDRDERFPSVEAFAQALTPIEREVSARSGALGTVDVETGERWIRPPNAVEAKAATEPRSPTTWQAPALSIGLAALLGLGLGAALDRLWLTQSQSNPRRATNDFRAASAAAASHAPEPLDADTRTPLSASPRSPAEPSAAPSAVLLPRRTRSIAPRALSNVSSPRDRGF